MHEYVPDIEADIPLPSKATEAMPDLSPSEELEMRARTIKLLSDLTNTPIIPSENEIDQAKELAKQMMSDPRMRPDYAQYPNETIATLAGMVAQMNASIVEDLSELKMYVVNKLVMEVETAKNPKDRISALSKLGEVDGVDAFKKRTETTITVKPIEEVEKELLTILENVEYAVLGENEAPEELEAAVYGENEVQNEESEIYNG